MKRLLICATALVFIGCGSGSNSVSSVEGTEDITEEVMEMSNSQVYQVYPGDIIKNLSEDTQLIITHNDSEDESSVELIQGRAELIRNL